MNRKVFLQTMITLASASLGLVAALAWNEAIKAIIKEVLQTGESIAGLLTYAILATVIAVVVVMLLARAASRIGGEAAIAREGLCLKSRCCPKSRFPAPKVFCEPYLNQPIQTTSDQFWFCSEADYHGWFVDWFRSIGLRSRTALASRMSQLRIIYHHSDGLKRMAVSAE